MNQLDEAKEFTKNTGISLNEDVIEKVPVKRVRFDPNTEKISHAWEMEERTVRYIHAPKVKMRCNDGDHVFRCIDNRRYVFACTICPFKRIVYPTTYSFNQETGKLTHKITGKVI